MSMLSLKGCPSTRWALVGTIVLVSLWLWQQPHHLSKLSTSLRPEPLSGFFPSKIYDPDALLCNDQTAAENSNSNDDPDATSIPALQGSAPELPSDFYDPYPEYNSRKWRRKWKGTHAPCLGPRGVEVNSNPDDIVEAHRLEKKASRPTIGSYRATGLESDFCFDRNARYDPYGYDDEFPSGLDAQPNREVPSKVTWRDVRWGELQRNCLARNEDRYESTEFPNRTDIVPTHDKFWLPTKDDHDDVGSTLILPPMISEEDVSYQWWRANKPSHRKKQALVLRTWDGNEWTIDTMQYVRSFIMELGLHSGLEYEVIILVEIKDCTVPIFEDAKTYRETLLKSVPEEFADITILFNRIFLETWYPKVGKQDPQTSQTGNMHMPMELLSLLRPDIEFFWQTELDARYTGHHYHFLETVSAWAAKQPRKFLWERNARYYVPAVHGTWENFSTWTANVTSGGGIWGPERTTGIEPCGPQPPTPSSENDSYEWGVGEDADFINVSPVFDVTEGSNFLFKNTKGQYPDKSKTPARATATVPLTRFSKRLLRAMHHGQVSLGLHMFPEMYPESTALHHGLKLVVFPLPVYVDYAKSPRFIADNFNANEGKTLLNPPYMYPDIWHRMTYWHSMDKKTTYPDELYKRWLGYSGDPLERVCLPGILLHPIKGV